MNRAQRRALQKSAQKNPSSSSAAAPQHLDAQIADWWTQAQTRQNMGQAAEAAAIYRRILKLAPNHVQSLHQLGILEAATQRHARAVDFLQKALSVQDDFIPALYSLGAVLHQMEQPEESIPHYLKALSLRPDHAEIRNALGLAYAAVGMLDEALEAYGQALKNDPRFFPAALNRASIYMLGERYEQAEADLKHALSQRPQDLDIRLRVVDVLNARQQRAEALALLRESTHPSHLPSRIALAEMLFENNHFEEAVRILDAVLDQKPDQARALYLRGASLRRLDRHEDSARDLKTFRNLQAMSLQERDFLPQEIYVQLSRRCNLRCTMCGHAVWQENSGFISDEVFDRVLSECKKNSIDRLTILAGQGEPFLHPQIFELLEKAVAYGLKVSIVTNGTPFTPERIRRLAGIGLESIQFSFAGYDRESYESIYVGAKFDQVLANLTLLDRTLKELRSKTVLHVKGVADSDSREFVEKTRAFLQSLGIHRLSTVIPNNFGGTIPQAPLYEGYGIHSYRSLDKHVRTVCRILLRSIGIYFDGRVTACGCYDANGALFLGDIMKEGLADIRKGERWRGRLVESFVNDDVASIPMCGTCDDPFG